MFKPFSILILIVNLAGCAGVVTSGDTSQLRPGMTINEATAVMGAPSGTQFISNNLIHKYSIHRPFVGYIPLYLIYESKTQKLISWQENLAEYYANQSLWMDATRPLIPQKVDVNANVNHYVW
jgi:hypothetical protein